MDSRHPSNDPHYRKLERLYAAAPITQWFGTSIRIEAGRAEVRLGLRTEFHHAAGGVHGAVQFRMLDDAAFFAANSTVLDALLVTVSITVQFLRPVRHGELLAAGRLTHGGAQILFAESDLHDAAGRMIARASGTFTRSRVGLDPYVG